MSVTRIESGWGWSAVFGRTGLRAFGTFLSLAAAVAGLAAVTLLWPQSPVRAIWALKEASYRQLLDVRRVAAPGFVLLAAVLAVAGHQWRRGRRLGWRLATLVLGANLLADLVTLAATRRGADIAAVCLDALVLMWLVSPATRRRFGVCGPARRPGRRGAG